MGSHGVAAGASRARRIRLSRKRVILVERVGRGLQALLAGARAVTAAAAADFAGDALQPASFHIARCLDAHGPMRSNDLALGVAMDKSAVSRLLNELEAQQLVQRGDDADDKRAKVVSLTAAGRKRLQRALVGKGRALDERLASFDDEDLGAFAALLERLNTPRSPTSP